MANSKEKEIQVSNQTDTPQTPEKKGVFFSIFLIVLIVLFAIAAGAGGFYLWQQQQTYLTDQIDINSRLQQKLDSLDAALNQFDSKLGNQLTNTNDTINDLKIKQDELAELSQKAIAVSNRGQKEWILAEIDYLLRLANRRLQISRDINSAIAAMTAADQRIFDLGDLNLFPVRKQLKTDIANLKALHQIDVNGITMGLDQMLVHLSSLPFKTLDDEIKSQLDLQEDVAEENEKAKNSFVDSVINTVMDIGDIKIHHRSLEPAPVAAQQHQVEQVLRGHLLAARLSVLRFDQIQFTHDLKQSHNILQQYYNLSDNRVAQMKLDIEELGKLNISPELPDINKAWNMLNDAIAGKDLSKTTTSKKTETIKPEKIQPEKVEVL